MTPDEIRTRIDAIIDEQDAALVEIRTAGSAFDAAMAGMRSALDAMHAANEAHDAVLARIIAANKEARRISRGLLQ
jgi:hypothetical protein